MKRGTIVLIMLILVFLALVANLVLYVVTGEIGGSVEFLKYLIYGSIVAADLLLVGAGVYFTTASIRKHPRSHSEWSRRGFLANGVIAGLIGISPWIVGGDNRAKEMFNAGVFLVALGVSTILFAYAAYRDYNRVRGTAGRKRRTPTLESAEK